MDYDVIVIGAGPGGVFAAYELTRLRPELRVAVFEGGHALRDRKCPIDGDKIKSCIGCKSCSIMSGFGGAGAFSDGKYNITNDFGGTLYEYIGKKQALELMHYVDSLNMQFGGAGTRLYSTAGTKFKKLCMQNDLHLLDASVRHLGTDINYVVLENLYAHLRSRVDFFKYRVKEELYDYVSDPHALHNLIDYTEYREMLDGFRVQMFEYMRACQDGLVDNFYHRVILANGLEGKVRL